MKNFILCTLLMLAAFISGAQAIFPTPFQFEVIDTIPGTKADLFAKASQWMARAYGSSKKVIELSDPGTGKIIGKASLVAPRTHVGFQVNENVNYTIEFTIKDGRYRCLLFDFYNDGSDRSPNRKQGPLSGERSSDPSGMNTKQWMQHKVTAQVYAEAIISEIHDAMRVNNEREF